MRIMKIKKLNNKLVLEKWKIFKMDLKKIYKNCKHHVCLQIYHFQMFKQD